MTHTRCLIWRRQSSVQTTPGSRHGTTSAAACMVTRTPMYSTSRSAQHWRGACMSGLALGIVARSRHVLTRTTRGQSMPRAVVPGIGPTTDVLLPLPSRCMIHGPKDEGELWCIQLPKSYQLSNNDMITCMPRSTKAAFGSTRAVPLRLTPCAN